MADLNAQRISDFALEGKILPPILGFENTPIPSFSDCLQPVVAAGLVPDLESFMFVADMWVSEHSTKLPNGMSLDAAKVKRERHL